MVEGALTLLVLFVTFFGIMDFGRLVWTYTTIAHGAREATRYAIVHGSASANPASVATIQGIVLSRSPGLSSSNITTTVTYSPNNQNAGSSVQVLVNYTFYPITPYIPVGAMTLKSTSQMVIYQ
jgi:Flp pilus assembly protein TadG